MSEEEIKKRLDQIKDLVILSNTRINYLRQLNDLIFQKNRMIFRFEGFYSMVIRDLNGSVLGAVRALVETKQNTHNINTLAAAMRKWSDDHLDTNERAALYVLLDNLTRLVNEDVAKKATRIASSSYAHKSLKLPNNKLSVTYGELEGYLTQVGHILNEISGLIWDSSTVLFTFESEGDAFMREMQYMERAEHVGTWLLRLDSDHEAVSRADELLAKKNASDNGTKV